MTGRGPDILKSVIGFYADGFREMTWGRPLWGLIILKLVILFAVLRVFFFQPAMAGKSDAEKSDTVGAHFCEQAETTPEINDYSAK